MGMFCAACVVPDIQLGDTWSADSSGDATSTETAGSDVSSTDSVVPDEASTGETSAP